MAGLVTALPESEWDQQVEGTLAGRAALAARESPRPGPCLPQERPRSQETPTPTAAL